MNRTVLCALLLACWPGTSAAQEELFHQGNMRYQEGDYGGAIEAYHAVERAGFDSGALQYNLGNAYFKLGVLPRAILHYERALRLLPGDDDVRANLELARSLTPDDITPTPRFWLLAWIDAWIDLLPRAWLVSLVGGAWVALCTAGIVRVVSTSPTRRRWSARGAWASAAVLLLFGTSLVVREAGLWQPPEGVVLAEQVEVRSAPSADPNLTLFSIHGGTKVRLDRVSDGWTEIVLEDGRVGWVPSEAYETI